MTGAARSVGDRLTAARRSAFVGRDAEVELFAQALDATLPPYSVLFVHGPGGIGKSTLLDRLADDAASRGVPTIRADARSLSPGPEGLLAVLGVSALDALAERLGSRHVILVDTYEELGVLDPFVRERLLPALPEGVVLVLAGRDAPSTEWRSDPGLAALVRVRALRNLRAEESATLLAARGVPEPLRASAHALTHGHPLALALVAELARDEALPMLAPDVVRVLLDRIVRDLSDPDRRAALEIAAMVRVTTASLLDELGIPTATSVFAWMRSLSFVSETPEGLAPHDLVRDALTADLELRDPVRAASLRDRVLGHCRRALDVATGRERERAFFDWLFGVRRDPTMRRFYDWELGLAGSSRALRDAELAPLLADIERYEGATSAAIAHRWWERQRSAFLALLDRHGEHVGALVYLHLDALDPEDEDPAIRSLAIATRDRPVRSPERVAVLRYWIWRDGYQVLAHDAHAPHSMVVSLDWALNGSLSWVGLVVQNIDVWRPFFERISFDEQPRACFSLDAHSFAVLTRDLRVRPWAGLAGATRPASPTRARVVLSQEDFAREVKEALRRFTRPSELETSTLLQSRLLADWAEDEAPTAAMLRELLEIAVSSLDDSEDERPRRCIETTFLRPAPTHEAAAERLALSFSTYRRQLARGVDGVVAYLWDREIHGARR